MISLDQNLLLLAFLVCLGACAIVDTSQLTGNEGRRELIDIISATHGKPIEPQLMLEVLKRYRETFGKYDYENVDLMIEVANVNESKCNGPAFRKINYLLKERIDWSLNMVPYLIDAKRRQFKICRDNLAHKMLESIEELSKKQVLQLENIMKSVQEVRQASVVKPTLTIDDWNKKMKSVLSAWIKSQFDLKSIKDSESFERMKQNEYGSCFSMVREFTGPILAYETFMDDSEIVQLIDTQTLSWVKKYNLCASIIELDYAELESNEEADSPKEPNKKSKGWRNKMFKSS